MHKKLATVRQHEILLIYRGTQAAHAARTNNNRDKPVPRFQDRILCVKIPTIVSRLIRIDFIQVVSVFARRSLQHVRVFSFAAYFTYSGGIKTAA